MHGLLRYKLTLEPLCLKQGRSVLNAQNPLSAFLAFSPNLPRKEISQFTRAAVELGKARLLGNLNLAI